MGDNTLEVTKQQAAHEGALLKQLRHPYIVRMYEHTWFEAIGCDGMLMDAADLDMRALILEFEDCSKT